MNPDPFETTVNLSNHHLSIPTTVTKFLHAQGKVLAIEPTIDTKEFGTYRLITYNEDYETTNTNIG